jgi:hypothetical protein
MRNSGTGPELILVVRRPLTDSKDDELRGSQRRDTNQTDKPAIIEIVLSHRCTIALHEKRLLGLDSQ